jgi:hypothetical protein
MITDERSLEMALERITAYLERPPREGTPQDAEFASLLEEVAQYQSQLRAPPAKSVLEGLVERADALVKQAGELRRARQKAVQPRWSSFPEDGEGIGPTTGV